MMSTGTNSAAAAAILFPGSNAGERLKYIRKKSDLSRAVVAGTADVHITQNMLTSWESGRINISEEDLRALAKMYACKVENLVTPEELQAIRAYDRDPKVMNLRRAMRKSGEDKRNRKDAGKAKSHAKKADAGKVPQKKAAAPEGGQAAQKKAFSCSNGLETLAAAIKKARQDKGVDRTSAAGHAGMTDEAYGAFENGKGDITVTQLVSICKRLELSPSAVMEDAFNDKWLVFRAKPKDIYAALGVCLDHKIEHVLNIEDGFIRIYGNQKAVGRIFQNLGIVGDMK